MRFFLLIVTTFSILLVSCSKNQEKDIGKQIVKDIHINDSVVKIAEPIVKMLKDSLIGELTAAIKTGGTAGAIEICNTKALQITNAVAAKSKIKVELKRVTNKYRNPENSPDANDKTVLASYEADFASGKNPLGYIVLTLAENNNPVYYYYTPLKIMPLCLNCHGDPATMDKQLVGKLKRLYPQDKATGYKEGDFRGLVRVKIIGKI